MTLSSQPPKKLHPSPKPPKEHPGEDLTFPLNFYSRFMDLMDQRTKEKISAEAFQNQMRWHVMADLEWMYQTAKNKGNMSTALKAKELQGKDVGMFGKTTTKKSTLTGVPVKPLSQMTLEELHYILSSSCEDLGIDMEAFLQETRLFLRRSEKAGNKKTKTLTKSVLKQTTKAKQSPKEGDKSQKE